jgi:hypothetical protein
VICNGYSIHTFTIDGLEGIHHPRSWRIEGSSDGNDWMILDEKRDSNDLRESDFWRSFRIGIQVTLPQIGPHQTGLHHRRDHILALSALEISGTLLKC